MTELVGYEAAAGLATLTMDNPPLNALGQALRAALWAAIERAEADPQVQVICLAAAGRSWPVGADIREFGHPPAAPTLPALCNRIAAATKPVIAALHGTALGGGLELALVCALRVAAASARLGLPEVTLGILPGAGGTQRLPRLVGAAAALDMILSGVPVPADRALAIGLVDRITTGDLLGTVRSIAAAHVEGRAPLTIAGRRRQPGLADAPAYLAAVQAERARPRPAHERAAPRIVECVEAALLLPEAAGLEAERAAFAELVATPEARALRHAFFAERRSARSVAQPAGAAAQVLATVAIVGGGAIGSGLAGALIARGVTVQVIERDEPALVRSLKRIARGQDQAVARGEIDADQRSTDWARLAARAGLTTLAGADLVIEAVSEATEVKTRVLAAIGAALAPGVPVLSVTCGHDPVTLARASGRPQAHGTLWFTEPLSRVSLAELAVTADAGPAVRGAALALARRLGWRLLGVPAGAGFLGPLYATAVGDTADRLLAAGAAPYEIDRALRAFGMPFGVFELRDLYGHDHALLRHPARRPGVREEPLAAGMRAWLAGSGRTGRRAVHGWHDYAAPGSPAQPAAVVAEELSRHRPAVALGQGEIDRCLIAGLANQGAWWLAEGRAPAEIDLVAMAQGFPRWRGGPMQAADEAGLLGLRNLLAHLGEGGDGFWQPAPIWDELIKNGRRFADLNRD